MRDTQKTKKALPNRANLLRRPKSGESARILDQQCWRNLGKVESKKTSVIFKKDYNIVLKEYFISTFTSEERFIELSEKEGVLQATPLALPCQPAFHACPALPCDLYRWRYCWLLLILAQPTGNDSSTLFIIPQDQVDPTQKVLAKISI